ncbi:S1 family peptidase [Salinibacter ruber]|uniref:S1 family peptidase n=2 Tax=Salinibacter ruber TaxID=146919 RepID=UPI00216A1263|nr:serine protease [Salinibacter ruber]
MMRQFENIADATVRIEYESSRGSGFHFIDPEFVVTNHHVVEGVEASSSRAVAVSDRGHKVPLDLLDYSSTGQHDFAIFKAAGTLPPTRKALSPNAPAEFERGEEVAFAGFPHGVDDLLVQEAVVSGLVDPDHFYIDGSVNGGNSGGPIVNLQDGSVIGIVTDRRFLGKQDLSDLQDAAEDIRQHCKSIQGRGSVELMGIDFGAFAQLMAEGMMVIQQALEANANTGIGIGYSISFAEAKFNQINTGET